MNNSRWNYKFARENPVYFAHLYLKMLQTTVDEERFVAEKLSIPPNLPRILKEFTKSAIRTQPYDLLRWSVAYFQALSDGEIPPVKERLEFPPMESESGLTPGYLRILNKQIGGKDEMSVSVDLLSRKWSAICLKETVLKDLLQLLQVDSEQEEQQIMWNHFIVVAAGHISQSPLQTMVQVCEVLTQEPEGSSACIPYSTFQPLYQLISILDAPQMPGIGPAVETQTQDAVMEHLKSIAQEQANNVTPRNLAHFTCPKLY